MSKRGELAIILIASPFRDTAELRGSVQKAPHGSSVRGANEATPRRQVKSGQFKEVYSHFWSPRLLRQSPST